MAIQIKPNIALLNFQEFSQVKESFTTVFDWMVETIVNEGDVDELTKHLSDFFITFKLYQLPIPEVIEKYNTWLFTIPLIRDFHLELLERFSMEITSIGPQVFERLINTLAYGASICKSQWVKTRTDGLGPTLLSFNRNEADVLTVYQYNPWFVTLTLLNTQFKKTALGQGSFRTFFEQQKP